MDSLQQDDPPLCHLNENLPPFFPFTSPMQCIFSHKGWYTWFWDFNHTACSVVNAPIKEPCLPPKIWPWTMHHFLRSVTKNLTGVNFFIQIDFKPSTSTTFLPCCKIIIIAFFLLPSPIQHHLWFKVKALLNELFSINAFHFQWLLFFWSDQSLLYGLKLQQTMWLVTSPTQPNTQRFPLSNFFGVSSPSIKTHCSHNKAIATSEHCFIRDHHFSDTRCENCHLQLGTDGSSATLISFSYKRRSTTKVELNQNDSTVRIKQRIHWVQRWLCVWLQLLLPLLSACSEKEISSLFWKRQVQEKIDFWIMVSLYFAAGWRWVDIFVHIHRVFATLRATSVDISLVRTGRIQLCLCTKASKKKLPYLAVSFISTGGYTSATTRISTWVDIHR